MPNKSVVLNPLTRQITKNTFLGHILPFHWHRVLHFCTGMRRNLNYEKVTYVFRFLVFFPIFYPLSFFSFSYLLLLFATGRVSSSHNSEKASSRRQFLPSNTYVWSQNFAPSFSLKFLSIFVKMSSSIEQITLIWISLERFLL